jgi:hypothetical protein
MAGLGEIIQETGIDERRVQAIEDLHEALYHFPERRHSFRKVVRPESAVRVAGRMGHGFKAKDALAFRVDLQSQAPETDAQDSQIVFRCLEPNLQPKTDDPD